MKFRKDFVTNSSSSSFICDVCGDVQSGWDLSLIEADMIECVNGHTFCIEHVDPSFDEAKYEVGKECILEDFKNDRTCFDKEREENESDEDLIDRLLEDHDFVEEYAMDNYFNCYECIPAMFCPICNHKHVLDSEIIKYAADKLGVEQEELVNMTRQFLIESEKEK